MYDGWFYPMPWRIVHSQSGAERAVVCSAVCHRLYSTEIFRRLSWPPSFPAQKPGSVQRHFTFNLTKKLEKARFYNFSDSFLLLCLCKRHRTKKVMQCFLVAYREISNSWLDISWFITRNHCITSMYDTVNGRTEHLFGYKTKVRLTKTGQVFV